MAERPDMTAELPRIGVPALVLCGEADVIAPAEEMRGIAEAMPNATFHAIADAGHMAPLEQPETVNRLIVEFLS
jgi:pimeloyl-ACP methyl ester carboxylesterase